MIMADQLDSKPGRRKVALALQGGGSHGAFTWGVLDRSLEEPTIDIMIEESDKGRIPQLVPLRHGRMLESLITFIAAQRSTWRLTWRLCLRLAFVCDVSAQSRRFLRRNDSANVPISGGKAGTCAGGRCSGC
jgi:hypothetical protein